VDAQRHAGRSAPEPDDADTASTTAIPAAAAAGAGRDGGRGEASWSPGAHGTGTIPAHWDDEPEPEPEGPVVQRPGGRRWGPLLLALVVLAVAGVAVLGLLGGDEVLESSPEGDGGDDGGEEVAAIEPVDASDFDPFGDGEHPGDIPNAYDGNPDTTWQTQRYNSASFGNLKPGVGLYLDLGEPTSVSELRLALSPEGADVEVYAGDSAPSGGGDFDPGQWGEHAATVEGAAAETVIELDEAMEQQVWLIWFTSLPSDSGGNRVSVSDITFQG
jgi:hypothetical protein